MRMSTGGAGTAAQGVMASLGLSKLHLGVSLCPCSGWPCPAGGLNLHHPQGFIPTPGMFWGSVLPGEVGRAREKHSGHSLLPKLRHISHSGRILRCSTFSGFHWWGQPTPSSSPRAQSSFPSPTITSILSRHPEFPTSHAGNVTRLSTSMGTPCS